MHYGDKTKLKPRVERKWWMVTLKGGETFELFSYSNEFLDALMKKLEADGNNYDALKYPPLRTDITNEVRERMAKKRANELAALETAAV